MRTNASQLVVWRHNQRYFSYLCDGTDVQADSSQYNQQHIYHATTSKTRLKDSSVSVTFNQISVRTFYNKELQRNHKIILERQRRETCILIANLNKQNRERTDGYSISIVRKITTSLEKWLVSTSRTYASPKGTGPGVRRRKRPLHATLVTNSLWKPL